MCVQLTLQQCAGSQRLMVTAESSTTALLCPAVKLASRLSRGGCRWLSESVSQLLFQILLFECALHTPLRELWLDLSQLLVVQKETARHACICESVGTYGLQASRTVCAIVLDA
jgi:hypothetical protein